MFAVQGWSITAPLKTQTKTVNATSSKLLEYNAESTGKKRKRKARGRERDPDELTGSNATPLVVKKSPERAEKKEKRRKMDDEVKVNGQAKVDRKSLDVADSKGKSAEDVKLSEKLTRKERRDRKLKQESSLGPVTNGQAAASKPTSKPAKPTKAPKDLASTSQEEQSSTPKLTPLQASMRAKLSSARFRHLNETLYTSPSTSALDLFTKNPEMFSDYHSGFRQQVEIWPENPVDSYIDDIRRRGTSKPGQKAHPNGEKPLARTHGTCTIADLGCGDAKLAMELERDGKKLNLKILSFDLYSPSPRVQRADIADLPLDDGSVNIAIFCLALMGTNWPDFIDEAYRILHWKGELWIAEIKSRFGRVDAGKKGKKVVEHSVGNRRRKPRSKMSEVEKRREDEAKKVEDETLAVEVDEVMPTANPETDVGNFVKALAARGFLLDDQDAVVGAVDMRNKMFVKMRFVKAAVPSKGKNAGKAGAGAGEKGGEGSTWKPKGKKFLEREEEEVDEASVLKPCVYKLR